MKVKKWQMPGGVGGSTTFQIMLLQWKVLGPTQNPFIALNVHSSLSFKKDPHASHGFIKFNKYHRNSLKFMRIHKKFIKMS